MEIRKFVAPEFVLGEGALQLVGRYAVNLAAKKALVVTDAGVLAAGWVAPVLASLEAAGIGYEVFSAVTPNPRDHEVMQGAERFREAGCDIIVAVGGGSPMDCAKGIGIVATSGQSILGFEGVDQVRIPGPPLICVPTTAGSSADVSQFAIVSDTTRRVKIAVISKAMVPDAALIDPITTTSMPAKLTAATGIDALVHAIEAYVSTASSPVTDLQALRAMQLIWQNLQPAIAQPQAGEFRDAMMLGSLLAGLAFSNASLGLVHAMAHSLGGLLDLPHGECNALLLEHVVAFNFPAAAARYVEVAAAFGLDLNGLPLELQRQSLVEALHGFRAAVGLGHGLASLGVKPADIAQLAHFAYQDPCAATNPVDATVEQIEYIYGQAL